MEHQASNFTHGRLLFNSKTQFHLKMFQAGESFNHSTTMVSVDTIDMTVTADILMLASEEGGSVLFMVLERLQHASRLAFKPTIGIKVLCSVNSCVIPRQERKVYSLNEAAKLTKASGQAIWKI